RGVSPSAHVFDAAEFPANVRYAKLPSRQERATMPYPIREATTADIPALQELTPLSARALSVGYYTSAQTESMITNAIGVDTQLIRDGTYFVVEDGEQLVGCGGWSKRATLYGGDQAKAEDDPLLDPATDAARIRAFFVHPSFARRGIGRALMERCEAE